jgi:hypothetical protein
MVQPTKRLALEDAGELAMLVSSSVVCAISSRSDGLDYRVAEKHCMLASTLLCLPIVF